MMTEVKTVKSISRVSNSTSGNPTWRLRFTDGSTRLTRANGTIGYEVGDGWIGKTFLLTIEQNRVRIAVPYDEDRDLLAIAEAVGVTRGEKAD